MDKYDHPKGDGAIFKNKDKKKETHPDFRGHVNITSKQLKRLAKMGKKGQEVKLTLALWKRKSQNGLKYWFISTEAYMKPEQDSSNDFADDDIPF